LDDGITRLLRATGSERPVRAFEPVLNQGSDADLLCLVRAGELWATVGVPGGERIVAEYGPGAWFGSLDGPSPVTVTATRASRVTVVEDGALEALLGDDRLVAGAIQAGLDLARWDRMRVLSGSPSRNSFDEGGRRAG
jgi:CRP-like cAMP-binding protein